MSSSTCSFDFLPLHILEESFAFFYLLFLSLLISQLLPFLRLTICSLLLSLVLVLSTVLKPYLRIYNDSLLSCDKGHLSLLLCLDLSSAFDTVDHSSLIQQLETSFGLFGSCLKWTFLYLSSWSSVVSITTLILLLPFSHLVFFRVLFLVLPFLFLYF